MRARERERERERERSNERELTSLMMADSVHKPKGVG